MGGKKDPLDRFAGMQSVVFKWGNFIVRVIERITLLNFAIIVDVQVKKIGERCYCWRFQRLYKNWERRILKVSDRFQRNCLVSNNSMSRYLLPDVLLISL